MRRFVMLSQIQPGSLDYIQHTSLIIYIRYNLPESSPRSKTLSSFCPNLLKLNPISECKKLKDNDKLLLY